MKRKLEKCMMLSMAACLLLGGCQQQNGGGAKESSNEAKEQITITYMSRFANEEEPDSKYYMERLAKFQEENPDIKVEDLSVVELDAYKTKLKSTVASGKPVDIFTNYGNNDIAEWVESGVVKDISDIISAEDWNGPAGDGIYESFNYSARGINGIYGVPTKVLANMLYVNTRILDECGLKTPETWEDVLEMTPVLKENGYIPMALGAKTKGRVCHWHTLLALQMWGMEFKDDLVSGKEKWTGDKMMEVINTFKSFIDQGVFGEFAISDDATAHEARFINGEAAMMMDLSVVIPQMKSSKDYDSIKVTRMPYFKEHPENKDLWYISMGDAYSITVDKDSPKYDAVVKLLKFMTEEETYKEQNELWKGGVFPMDVEINKEGTERLMQEYMESFAKKSGGCDELDVYFEMPNTQDVVRNEMQTLFAGREPDEIAAAIQKELDNYQNNK
ncbi:ABC transporter substrate-binding protein [Murimonas intestini]|uniref:ABC transporter substrate-binding protein n=1 Tax=Murimonas intestini TaxID=1337051 RepID=UPI0011DDC4AD|nr:extracellular solute-binding protein [Murimonas intestini]